jgi:hypothetical protein
VRHFSLLYQWLRKAALSRTVTFSYVQKMYKIGLIP